MIRRLNLLTKVVLLVILALAFVQCNDVEPAPTTESFTSVDDYLKDDAPVSVKQTFDAAVGTSFTTAKGSDITIPPGAFMTKAGQVVTGQVEFRIKEVFSTKDIISSGVFPVSFSSVLNSGGEFYAGATANGEELIVADGKFMTIEIPAQAVDPAMQIFLAQGDEDPQGDTAINWEAQNDTIGQGRGFNGSFTFKSADNSYEIQTDSTGWGNIDAFIWPITYFDCTFDLTGLANLSNANTTAYAVFKDQNSIWPVGTSSWGDITNNVISETHLADVPMNLLVISVVDEQLYYGVLDVTPVANTTYSIAMEATTSDDLDAIIAALP